MTKNEVPSSGSVETTGGEGLPLFHLFLGTAENKQSLCFASLIPSSSFSIFLMANGAGEEPLDLLLPCFCSHALTIIREELVERNLNVNQWLRLYPAGAGAQKHNWLKTKSGGNALIPECYFLHFHSVTSFPLFKLDIIC